MNFMFSIFIVAMKKPSQAREIYKEKNIQRFL